MKRKILASVIMTAAFALTITAACSDNNSEDYIREHTTTEPTTTVTETTTTTTEATTEATTAAKKEYQELVNTYSGTYVATQGLTGLDFSVFGTDEEGKIQALFSFHEDPANPGVPTGSYHMEGTVEKSENDDIITVDFKGEEWEKKPETYHIIEFKGVFDVKKGTLESDDYEIKLKKSAGADLTYLINNYDGLYSPDIGDNRVKLTVEDVGEHGDLQAVFEYEPQVGKKASFITIGQVTNIAPDGKVTVTFEGSEWIEEAEDKKFIDFEGVFSADGLGFTENGGHNIRVYAQ